MGSNIYRNHFVETINKIENIKKELKFFKVLLKFIGYLSKEAYKKLNEKAQNKEIELQKNESLIETIKNLNIIANKLYHKINELEKEDKSGGGTSGNSGQLLIYNNYNYNEKIKELELEIEKQRKENLTYKDLAKIAKITSDLCKLVEKTINKVEEVDKILDIFKDILGIIFEVISLIHPLLQQLKIDFKTIDKDLKIELGKDFNKMNFNDFVIAIIDADANNLDKEMETKVNNTEKEKNEKYIGYSF